MSCHDRGPPPAETKEAQPIINFIIKFNNRGSKKVGKVECIRMYDTGRSHKRHKQRTGTNEGRVGQ